MGKNMKEGILFQKDFIIQQLLKLNCFKSSDDRQLYELTLPELESEYKLVKEKHHSVS
ncbi:Fur-regulated basic protein FbpA [Metabacillus halosaccharovorans]|uniref:Fur-regulated basic protein FbpA n=1 Tax=Metabacillus halosaccharovorans TaxID=930124 RepID=UPI001C1F97E3|nr:Fur-regulated basic protein FbpA [Metabacillus halosaccharovorans]MBU7595354.1 Fur-regulated basic protein FbpA [Metabacillus halosaccharovorans]MCM3439941.1 Fur-regulated basic protein FbpA [Metabacillus halosaccharovorans]